jgi:riboflavin synthase
MFTGIVETTGKVAKIEKEGGNIHFTIETPIAQELKIDQSVAHDGVCLTTVKVDKEKNQYTVTAIQETLDKTNMRTWEVGYRVNLERCMRIDGRLDGTSFRGMLTKPQFAPKFRNLTEAGNSGLSTIRVRRILLLKKDRYQLMV